MCCSHKTKHSQKKTSKASGVCVEEEASRRFSKQALACVAFGLRLGKIGMFSSSIGKTGLWELTYYFGDKQLGFGLKMKRI